MNGYFTKRTTGSPSQSFPSTTPSVASDVTLVDTYVLLCDWHGQIAWKSGTGDRAQIGDEIWKHAVNRSKDGLRGAVASVVTLRENCVLDVEGDRNEHFRFWMWPLNDPEIAVCILARRIPNELALLTEREKACLMCLSQGKTTRAIAKELKIGLTTVHTHLRRSREKLGLGSGEALIGFAARYLYSQPPASASEPPASRKRSG
jgi:DNA-binding CsgD family transcriptional regulator